MSKELLTYVIDIDGTICKNQDGDYYNSNPIIERIEAINDLYDAGHIIKFFTARGMTRFTKEYFYELTKFQLEEWGCKYHELIVGKPSADIYIDDKSINADEFFKDCK